MRRRERGDAERPEAEFHRRKSEGREQQKKETALRYLKKTAGENAGSPQPLSGSIAPRRESGEEKPLSSLGSGCRFGCGNRSDSFRR
jgi:hypothetical protein